MDLDTLCTFFGMRLAFFFVFICVVTINLKYTQAVCVDSGIFLTLVILTDLVSVCYIDKRVVFWWGAIRIILSSSCNSNWFTKLSYY